jgi:hypothetical protein
MGYSFQTSSKKERVDPYNPECFTGKAVLFYRLSPKKENLMNNFAGWV